MAANSREYRRAPMSGSVKLYEWNRPYQGVATEISGGGLYLRTEAPLPEGSLVTLRLVIPGLAHAFTVLGKVARTARGGLLRPAGLAIRFVDISASDRRCVLEYVDRRALKAA